MRRALLTATTPTPTITVGNPAISRANRLGGGYVLVASENPATTAGTLTTINYYAATGGTVVFLTGSGTSTFTVTAASSSLSAANGANTFTVSLPIAVGNRVALWTPSSGGAVSAVTNSAGTTYYKSSASAPTAGAVLTAMASEPALISLQGVGS